MSPAARLGTGGRKLWREITDEHELSDEQLVILEAACVQRDRDLELDEEAKAGDLKAMKEQRDAQTAMIRFLAALRLPDAKTGRRPQARTIRAPQNRKADTNVTALDRARGRSAG